MFIKQNQFIFFIILMLLFLTIQAYSQPIAGDVDGNGGTDIIDALLVA